LQPKSGFLPEAGRGRPKFLEVEDGANETGQSVSRPLSRPSPTANLAGNWKGDPLIREVRGLKFTPKEKVMALSRLSWPRAVLGKLCSMPFISERQFCFLRPSRFTRSVAKSSNRKLLWKTSFSESFPSRFAAI
jgi:hypothetical protein